MCDIEEHCTPAFMKFGNYLNHVLVDEYHYQVEKLSFKDTTMKMYHAKLEKV